MANLPNINLENVVSRLTELKGTEVTHAWRGHGSAIFLELGQLTDSARSKNASGEQTIAIEWSWRIEDQNSILLGSWDNEKEIDRFSELVMGATIESINFFTTLNEIEISFSNLHRLLSFSTAKGKPEWSIIFKNKDCLSVSENSFHIEKTT